MDLIKDTNKLKDSIEIKKNTNIYLEGLKEITIPKSKSKKYRKKFVEELVKEHKKRGLGLFKNEKERWDSLKSLYNKIGA